MSILASMQTPNILKEYKKPFSINKQACITSGKQRALTGATELKPVALGANKLVSFLVCACKQGQLIQVCLQDVAVVCESGATSAQAAVRLKRVFGFSRVSNLKGGMQAWRAVFDIASSN